MMKKILVTQRIDKIDSRSEIREGVDIKLLELCMKIGTMPISVSSIVSNNYDFNIYLQNLSFDGIILSGGNDLGSYIKRDDFENKLLKLSILKKIPVFGICRGLQIINNYEKGSLIKIDNHCNTRHLIFGESGISSREVNSYHNYGITKETLGNNLQPIAFAPDESIEAVKHLIYPWMAFMWHPERETEFNNNDLEIISSHFKK